MNRTWGLALLGIALSASAIGYSTAVWANTPSRTRATYQYRCDANRNIIALERPEFISLMVAGRSYDLEWTDASTARGQGLIWHVAKTTAGLTRVSGGYAVASGCTRVDAQI